MTQEPVWSVIILLCCGLAFTLYCVIYILRLSFKELEEDGKVGKQRQEGSVKAEPGQCNRQEGKERG
jgi:DNA-binding transcriptional regulator YhcF (GntR family)